MPRVSPAPITQDDNVIMPEYRDKSINDMLDWLASIFGFQVNIVSGILFNLIMSLREGTVVHLFFSRYATLALFCLTFSNLALKGSFFQPLLYQGLLLFMDMSLLE